MTDFKREIIEGDCVDAMRKMPTSTIDLVYMDPPFNSGRDYGEFDDRWQSMDHYLMFMYRVIERSMGDIETNPARCTCTATRAPATT